MTIAEIQSKGELKNLITKAIDHMPEGDTFSNGHIALAAAAAPTQPTSYATLEKMAENYRDLLQTTRKHPSGVITEGVWADWSELESSKKLLMSDSGSIYTDCDKFGFYMGLGLVDPEIAKKLALDLSKKHPQEYETLREKYGTFNNIVNKYYTNRITIFIHLTYDKELLPHDLGIPVTFDVGRLCPPNCPKIYYQ